VKKGDITTAVPHTRHSGMFLAGLNLPGADLNSQRLVRRMKYMDVFHNPVTKMLDACVTSGVLPFTYFGPHFVHSNPIQSDLSQARRAYFV